VFAFWSTVRSLFIDFNGFLLLELLFLLHEGIMKMMQTITIILVKRLNMFFSLFLSNIKTLAYLRSYRL